MPWSFKSLLSVASGFFFFFWLISFDTIQPLGNQRRTENWKESSISFGGGRVSRKGSTPLSSSPASIFKWPFPASTKRKDLKSPPGTQSSRKMRSGESAVCVRSQEMESEPTDRDIILIITSDHLLSTWVKMWRGDPMRYSRQRAHLVPLPLYISTPPHKKLSGLQSHRKVPRWFGRPGATEWREKQSSWGTPGNARGVKLSFEFLCSST